MAMNREFSRFIFCVSSKKQTTTNFPRKTMV